LPVKKLSGVELVCAFNPAMLKMAANKSVKNVFIMYDLMKQT
jgi:hypothetical protein